MILPQRQRTLVQQGAPGGKRMRAAYVLFIKNDFRNAIKRAARPKGITTNGRVLRQSSKDHAVFW